MKINGVHNILDEEILLYGSLHIYLKNKFKTRFLQKALFFAIV
ncbi:hypothetical protein SAMN05421856_103142 [Chryseobacterium taichungense]|uniref:Uncharacterized protein n=1 Tax=Chryseobacterium taichungense TaxID=295069 RepID=A0A1H7Y859_9FLAO|nr:hypothetical protein SAMN05421856_103142 [Chryseobacterium taichungense]